MKKKLYLSVLGMFLFLSMFSLVAADKTTNVGVSAEGLQIFAPDYMFVKQYSEFSLHLHVSNISNGIQLSNTIVDCYIHLYNSTGDHTYERNTPMEKDSNGWDHELEINGNGGNFSDLGTHAYYIWCNSTEGLGGELRGNFIVNPTGTELTTAKSIFFGLIFLIIGFFLFISISGIKKASSGAWLTGYVSLTYILIYLLVGLTYLLSNLCLWEMPILGNVFYIIWFVMGIGLLPFIIIISLYILGQEAKAALEQDYMKQGYSREEARELSRKNKR